MILSVLCEPRKNYRIGLMACQKKKKRPNGMAAAISILLKLMRFILVYQHSNGPMRKNVTCLSNDYTDQ